MVTGHLETFTLFTAVHSEILPFGVIKHGLRGSRVRVGEMAQQLRALDGLPEVLSSILSMLAHVIIIGGPNRI